MWTNKGKVIPIKMIISILMSFSRDGYVMQNFPKKRGGGVQNAQEEKDDGTFAIGKMAARNIFI